MSQSMKSLMTLWRTRIDNPKPYRYHQPDLLYGRGYQPVTPKGVLAGALSQPAEYLGRYAWRHYGGTEKTRALALKAQREIPLYLKKQIIHRYYFDKYYAKKTKTKLRNEIQYKSKGAAWRGTVKRSRYQEYLRANKNPRRWRSSRITEPSKPRESYL